MHTSDSFAEFEVVYGHSLVILFQEDLGRIRYDVPWNDVIYDVTGRTRAIFLAFWGIFRCFLSYGMDFRDLSGVLDVRAKPDFCASASECAPFFPCFLFFCVIWYGF